MGYLREMNSLLIEEKCRELQLEIWKNRERLLGRGENDPLGLFLPPIAAEVLGVSYVEEFDLGRFGSGKNRYEVAGCLNRQRKEILISCNTKFSRESQTFTGAHEIAHWVLHPNEESCIETGQ